MAYNVKYKIQFRTILNNVGLVEILEKDYSGSFSELTGGIPPVIRSGKGDNDELEDRIIRSDLKIRVNSLTDYQFLELFTADAKRFKARLWIDSSLAWTGFLTPDYYSEPYVPAPYEVELLFTDGLGILKNKDWDIESELLDEGNTSKLITFADAIIYCIEQTGNVLPYSEAINIWEENMDTDESMLTQTYFDIRRFKGENCYDALDEILKACNNARLWQQAGRWWIVPINVMKAGYTTRNSSDLVTVTDDTVDPITIITGPTGSPLNVFLDQPELLMLPAWKKFTLKQDLGYDADLLKNKTYTKIGNWNVYHGDNNFIYLDAAEIISQANYIQFDLGYVTANASRDEYLNLEFKCIGPHDIMIGVALILDRSPDPLYSLKPESDPNYAEWVSGSYTLWQERTDDVFNPRKSRKIPYSGRLYLRVFQPYKIPGGSDYNGTLGFSLDDLKASYGVDMDVAEENVVTTEINGDQNYAPPDYEMKLGDLIYPISQTFQFNPPIPGGIPRVTTITEEFINQSIVYDGGLYWLDGTTYTATRNWKKDGSEDLKRLVNLIADEISVNHLRPQGMITGSLRCNFIPGSVIKTAIENDKLFVIKRFTEDFYNNEWECDLVAYADADQGYLKLRSGGYILMRNGGKIKIR